MEEVSWENTHIPTKHSHQQSNALLNLIKWCTCVQTQNKSVLMR